MKKKTAEIRHTQRFTEYYKDGKLYFPDSTEKLLFAIYGETAGITTEHLDYDELIEIITYRTEKELSEKVREIQEEYRQWEGDNVEYFHAVKTKDGLSDNVSSLRTDIVRALAGLLQQPDAPVSEKRLYEEFIAKVENYREKYNFMSLQEKKLGFFEVSKLYSGLNTKNPLSRRNSVEYKTYLFPACDTLFSRLFTIEDKFSVKQEIYYYAAENILGEKAAIIFDNYAKTYNRQHKELGYKTAYEVYFRNVINILQGAYSPLWNNIYKNNSNDITAIMLRKVYYAVKGVELPIEHKKLVEFFKLYFDSDTFDKANVLFEKESFEKYKQEIFDLSRLTKYQKGILTKFLNEDEYKAYNQHDSILEKCYKHGIKGKSKDENWDWHKKFRRIILGNNEEIYVSDEFHTAVKAPIL